MNFQSVEINQKLKFACFINETSVWDLLKINYDSKCYTKLLNLKKIQEQLRSPCVYIVLCSKNQQYKKFIYVGSTQRGFAQRFVEHKRDIRFAKEGLKIEKIFIFTSYRLFEKSLDKFTYFENRFIDFFDQANEIFLLNRTKGSLFFEKGNNALQIQKGSFENIFSEMIYILSFLDNNLSTSSKKHIKPTIATSESKPNEGRLLVFKGKRKLRGIFSAEGFYYPEKNTLLVLKGSKTHFDNLTQEEINMKKINLLKDKGYLVREGDYYYFAKNCLFDSPSSAAVIFRGSNSNGWICWKDKKTGQNLKQIFRSKPKNQEALFVISRNVKTNQIIKAQGRYSPSTKAFTVLKGSYTSLNNFDFFQRRRNFHRKLKEINLKISSLKRDGFVKEATKSGRVVYAFVKDKTFYSTFAIMESAQLLIGNSCNGLDEWKHETTKEAIGDYYQLKKKYQSRLSQT